MKENNMLPPDKLAHLHRQMIRIRRFEEKVADLSEEKLFKTPVHLYIGQEAVAAGVCDNLKKEDYIFGAHRSHGHFLAKGGTMNEMMAEIFGKSTGCSRGRGGSMHLISPENGVLGTVPIVAGTVSLAVGAALASKLRGEDRVTAVFFGDGAVEEGTVHESMNMAAVYQLPVLFVCENNFYSSHLELLERRAKDNLIDVPKGHGMEAVSIDGNDVNEVFEESQKAVERLRKGNGPFFMECRTFRWRGHVGPAWDIDVGVKRKDDLKEWMEKDPVKKVRKQIESAGGPTDWEKEEEFVKAEIQEAVEFARKSPRPEPHELTDNVYCTAEGGGPNS